MSEPAKPEKRLGKVIALVSPKGGTGKTTLALNYLELLARWGKKVLVIDADLSTRGMSYYVNRCSGGGLQSVVKDQNCLQGMFMAPAQNTPESYLPKPVAASDIYDLMPAEQKSVRYEPTFAKTDLECGMIAPLREFTQETGFREDTLFEALGRDEVDSEGPLRSARLKCYLRWKLLIDKHRVDYDFILIDTRGGADFASGVVSMLADLSVCVTEWEEDWTTKVEAFVNTVRTLALDYSKVLQSKYYAEIMALAENWKIPVVVLNKNPFRVPAERVYKLLDLGYSLSSPDIVLSISAAVAFAEKRSVIIGDPRTSSDPQYLAGVYNALETALFGGSPLGDIPGYSGLLQGEPELARDFKSKVEGGINQAKKKIDDLKADVRQSFFWIAAAIALICILVIIDVTSASFSDFPLLRPYLSGYGGLIISSVLGWLLWKYHKPLLSQMDIPDAGIPKPSMVIAGLIALGGFAWACMPILAFRADVATKAHAKRSELIAENVRMAEARAAAESKNELARKLQESLQSELDGVKKDKKISEQIVSELKNANDALKPKAEFVDSLSKALTPFKAVETVGGLQSANAEKFAEFINEGIDARNLRDRLGSRLLDFVIKLDPPSPDAFQLSRETDTVVVSSEPVLSPADSGNLTVMLSCMWLGRPTLLDRGVMSARLVPDNWMGPFLKQKSSYPPLWFARPENEKVVNLIWHFAMTSPPIAARTGNFRKNYGNVFTDFLCGLPEADRGAFMSAATSAFEIAIKEDRDQFEVARVLEVVLGWQGFGRIGKDQNLDVKSRPPSDLKGLIVAPSDKYMGDPEFIKMLDNLCGKAAEGSLSRHNLDELKRVLQTKAKASEQQ